LTVSPPSVARRASRVPEVDVSFRRTSRTLSLRTFSLFGIRYGALFPFGSSRLL
jgi:hypothetical protein